jgi:hypothetical protein
VALTRLESVVVPESLIAYRRAIEDCIAFLHNLGDTIAPRHVVAPKPSISSATGEVSLRWTLTDCLIDLGFEGDGKYSSYATYPDGRIYGSKGMVLMPLPEELVATLLRAG